ncbi:MAG: NF038122 family metalloprotease [Roseiarcus sp.]
MTVETTTGQNASGESAGPDVATGASGAGGLVFNVTYDQSQSALPSGFVAAVNYVVSYYESVFTNAATVNIDVGYGEIDGTSLGAGNLGESESYIASVPYAQAVAALDANEPAASQQAAYATLPASTPVAGGTMWMTTAQEKAVGLLSGTNAALDGYVGFSSTNAFSYSATATPTSGEYYFIGVVEHEFSEVMGRDSFLGEGLSGTTSYSLMDMFRYSASGERDTTATPPVANTAYFSINNGATDLGNWNTVAGGDLGDWASSMGNDSYLAFSSPNVINSVSPADLELMGVLGWDAPGLVVSNTQTDYISAGQATSGYTVLSGGYLGVQAGGTSLYATLSGGRLQISAGGAASATTVSSGALEVIYGTDSGAAIFNGGAAYVESGGVANGATVNSGHDFVEAGGVASGTTLVGGAQMIYGAASGTSASAGAYLYVEAGGTAAVALVTSGVAVVYGVTSGEVDKAHGYDYVEAGGVAIGATVSGSVEYVEIGGTANGTTVDGGEQLIYGMTSGTAVNSGAYEYLEAGGSASGGLVNSGILVVYGSTHGATIESAGYEYVYAGSVDRATTLSAGHEYVEVGAAALSATVDGGAEVAYGTTTATAINSGGYEYVYAGATASGTIVNSGVETVLGVVLGTTDASGGADYIYSGGTASGTMVLGGDEYVEAGGSAIGTVVSGGAQVVYGVASGALIETGGFDYVSSGGVANGTTISGGYGYVVSGGVVNGVAIDSGTLELTSGAVDGSAAIAFAASGGGTLRLDASVPFGGLIAGFGQPEHLDLSDIGFGSSTQFGFTEAASNLSGTLMVTDGLHTANLTLLGQYVTAQFTSASDGHGGTLIGDPPVVTMTDSAPASLLANPTA